MVLVIAWVNTVRSVRPCERSNQANRAHLQLFGSCSRGASDDTISSCRSHRCKAGVRLTSSLMGIMRVCLHIDIDKEFWVVAPG